MYRKLHKYSRNKKEFYNGRHRFEHWYIDNQVYFITGCCRDHFPALISEQAKLIFWDRLEHYCAQFLFFPWVVSVLSNHYHILGYARVGLNLKPLMQRLHGSVSVNDLLPERRHHFWSDGKGREYFDGCLRDEKQGRATYRYVEQQARRHKIMYDYTRYPHTRIYAPVDRAIRRALELQAFLNNVPYKRYGQ